ncbi:MAG: DUF5655 domain-containing protein [bacterium]
MILHNNINLLQEDFKNEKDLQNYFESNINTILKLQFITSELTVGDFRIDSLAFDPENKSFKIIEYKNVKNNSLIDQGYTYLKLLFERKADFLLKYNEVTKSSLTKDDIDWTQSRIIFVAPSFSKYQLNANNFKDLPIELYTITRYANEIVNIEQISKTSSTSIKYIKPDIDKVDNEIIVYNESDHLNNSSQDIKDTYHILKDRVLELDDIDIEFKKYYIAFKGRTNIMDLIFNKNTIKVQLNVKKGNLIDPLNLARDISDIGHWGNGDYQLEITNIDDVDILIPLIKQSLKINKK